MSKQTIGPSLPPGFGAPKLEEDSIGPQIPPEPSIGPQVPSSIGPEIPSAGCSGSQVSSDESEDSFDGIELHDEEELKATAHYGPALPPGFGKKKVLGPSLPQGGVPRVEEEEESEEEGGVIGPVVPGTQLDDAHWAHSLEQRAHRMKNKLTKPKDDKVTRESWMVDLPTDRFGVIGVEARQFRKNAGPDRRADNSGWTDTPEDKLRKQKGGHEEKVDPKEELEARVTAQRDRQMEKMARAHKREAKSLLEQHQHKSKQSKVGEGERQMFDREKDMDVHKFDDAQKKAAINKAKFLDDRFSSGNQKFL